MIGTFDCAAEIFGAVDNGICKPDGVKAEAEPSGFA